MSTPLKVWLDDKRLPPVGWNWARTAQQAIFLLCWENVEEISLDHDLGHISNGTGYDVIVWIEKEVFQNPSFICPKISIHSQNPVGGQKMKACLDKINKMMEDRTNG